MVFPPSSKFLGVKNWVERTELGTKRIYARVKFDSCGIAEKIVWLNSTKKMGSWVDYENLGCIVSKKVSFKQNF